MNPSVFLFIGAAAAGPIATDAIPAELEPWVPWVLDGHPTQGCPMVGAVAQCVWPGVLKLDVDSEGARFGLSVDVDREARVALPGGAGAWPQSVRVNGVPVPVRADGEGPSVTLPAGTHRVEGELRWLERPQALPLPPAVGLVSLRMDGKAVARVRRETNGALVLGGKVASAGAAARERLELDVLRRVQDGVPLVVRTRLVLRAAGSAREVDLGPALLEGTQAVGLTGDLPARIDGDGHLKVQVRPGSWTLELVALHSGPASALRSPVATSPDWPGQEFWSVRTDDQVRAVEFSGVPGVDPARTPLPSEWRDAPAFLVAPGGSLEIRELRRGEAEPPPDALSVSHELWLDLDGNGFTFRDTVSGTMHSGWRLDLAPGGTLGHARLGQEDQVITLSGAGDRGLAGVEVRDQAVQLHAEGRLPAGEPLPTVGWTSDAVSVSTVLQLPPGWRLVHAPGVDHVGKVAGMAEDHDLTMPLLSFRQPVDGTSIVENWDLIDALYVGILAVLLARVVGWRWALVGAVGLVLNRVLGGSAGTPWVLATLALTVEQALPKDSWWGVVARQARRLAIVILLATVGWREGARLTRALFPATEGRVSIVDVPDRFVSLASESDMNRRVMGGSFARGERVQSKLDTSSMKQGYLTSQKDPTAVVQTGPGVPDWTWSRIALEWRGRVAKDHRHQLIFAGPRPLAVLGLIQAAALGLLALRMAGLLGWVRRRLGSAAPLLVLGILPLLMPADALAAPDPVLLKDLETRLTAPPDCGEACVDVPELALRIVESGDARSLCIRQRVDAAAAGAVALPGPLDLWTPKSVDLNGRPATALSRTAGGVLMLRVDPGVHTIGACGPLNDPDALTLQLDARPRRAWVDAPGWTVQGLSADGGLEGTVQLLRTASGDGEQRSADNLHPWVEVRRVLDLGVPWRVRTEVRRIGDGDAPIALKVPILDGEAVTVAGVVVENGAVSVGLDATRREVSWEGALTERAALTLQMPKDVPWVEEWVISCSPVFSCAPAAGGPPPLEHVVDGRWTPRWRPWPGEALTVNVQRPDALAGQTLTVDRAQVRIEPGIRETEGHITMTVRSSQGAQQAVRLPADAELQSVTVGDRQVPVRQEDGMVAVPLQPGDHEVKLSWREPRAVATQVTTPALSLGAPAVNIALSIELPEERFAVWPQGPAWGPTPLRWIGGLVLALGFGFLGHLMRARTPLRTAEWAILGLGLSQLPPVLCLAVAGSFVALDARGRMAPRSWLRHNTTQLALGGLLFMGLVALAVAVTEGVVGRPDPGLAGGGSHGAGMLSWRVDRADSGLPVASVLSLPVWMWRAISAAWGLWLASRAPAVARWAWTQLTAGGLLQAPPPRVVPQPPAKAEE